MAVNCILDEDASTRPIVSATCVGTSQQLHSVEPSLPSSEPPTFTILIVKLVIRTSLGLHTSVVNPATIDYLHGLMARKQLSTLQSRWFEENHETTQMIVIFV